MNTLDIHVHVLVYMVLLSINKYSLALHTHLYVYKMPVVCLKYASQNQCESQTYNLSVHIVHNLLLHNFLAHLPLTKIQTSQMEYLFSHIHTNLTVRI